jgi:hypothetical protein
VALALIIFAGALTFVVDLNRPRVTAGRIDPAPLIWTIESFSTPSNPH